MNPKPKRLPPRLTPPLRAALTWLVITAQLLALVSTAAVGAIQPTPQMVQAAAQEMGLGAWIAQRVGDLTAWVQPLWGEPKAAQASAINDVAPLATNQIQTTIHPEENMVVNGSFESSPIIANGTGTRIIGWTILSGNSDIWNWWVSPDSSTKQLHVSGDQKGTVAQVVTGLEAGQSYYVEFEYTSETGSQAARIQLIDSGGADVINETVTSPGRPDGPGWRSYRNTFTAPADGQIEIRFSQLTGVSGTLEAFTVDDVRIAKRLTNYVTNGSFEGGRVIVNATTDIPGWSVTAGNVDIYNAYFRPDGSTRYLYVNGNTPGTIEQTVNGLTPNQAYYLDFEYASEGNISTQATAKLFDSGATVILNQTVTSPGDANNRGWQHFRATFTAPADGIAKLQFAGVTAGAGGMAVDNVRIAPAPLNWVVNGDFEAGPTALNIANNAIPGWTVATGPVDVVGGGLLYGKLLDLNGSPGNGKLEQTITSLTAGQVYAFQLNFASNGNATRYTFIRLLDSGGGPLLDKRVACDHDFTYQGWCTLRHTFTAPADGTVKIVLENDETDGATSHGIFIDNVLISRDLNFVINGNFSSGPTGLNQPFVPGWSITDRPDVHDGVGSAQYRFTIELNGTPGSVTARQNLSGLTPGQSYTLRYMYASTADSINAQFSAQVLPTSGAALVSVNQSTGLNGLSSNNGWREGRHTFTAPADGRVSILFRDIESDGNTNYGALIDNVSVFGSTTVAAVTLDICSTSAPAPIISGPGGVTNGLQFWVRADKSVFNHTNGTAASAGDQVKRWDDLSGYGLDVAPTSGREAVYRDGTAQTNYNPYLDFLNDYMANYSQVMPVYSDVTMLGVGYKTATGGIDTILSTGDNGNDPTLDVTNLDFNPWSDASSPAYVTHVGSPIIQGRIYLFDVRAANGVSNDLVAGLSGRDHANNMEILGASDLYMFRSVNIGSDGGGENWDGAITESIIFSRKLSGAELARVRSYLAIRNGITLDADPTSATNNYDYLASDGATVIWPGAGNAGYQPYHNDVAGIGRDDASALDQRKSISVNGDDPVTINNGGAFAVDKSFLVWGNNNSAASFATPYTPDSFTPTTPYYRMARIWKIQETGTITTVQVSLSMGAEYMIVDTDGDGNFATGTQDEVALSGGSFAYNFVSGHYFTFITAQTAPGGVATNLSLWLKADAGLTTGATMTWLDQSGNGHNASQSVAASQPTLHSNAINFNPSLVFANNRNNFLSVASPALPTGNISYTVFGVARASILTGGAFAYNYIYVEGSDSGNNRVSVGRINANMSQANYLNDLNAGALTVNTPYVLRYTRNSSGGARANVRNGLQVGSDTNTGLNKTNGVGYPRIGNTTAGAGEESWDGDIAEVIVYQSTLTPAQYQQIESYLAIKYGITLDQTTLTDYLASDGTTKVWDAHANTTYNNDIAGIGRDDASELDQRKSRSINGNDPLLVDNSAAFGADKSFLVWGNNNGAVSLTAAYNGGSNNRLVRVWKVAETGTVGTVKVILPRSAVVNAGLRSLIVHASDPTFGTVDRTYPLTVRGGNYEVTVNFNHGDFFTFSSSSTLPEINVIPATIDFGTVFVGITSPAQAVTIQNLGDVSLSLSGIALSGSDASQFAISSNNCGATLSAGASCTVQLTFTPTTAGAKGALLVINNNDSNENPVNVALSGASPNAIASFDAYNLAVTKSASVTNATIGVPFNYTVTVLNKGAVAASNVEMTDQLPAGVAFNSANATGGGACTHLSGTVTCTWASLASGASATVTISVTP
jgi:uncharacterized repeat protein (TIGR01451 family)